MSFADAENALQEYFKVQWDQLTPVAWPDVAFQKPDATWVRFGMTNNIGRQASTGSPGSNRFRRMGIVTIQVFAKANQGGVDARLKADRAVDIFMGLCPGFTFWNANAKEIGPDGHGWYQWNVTAEYKYDIIR